MTSLVALGTLMALPISAGVITIEDVSPDFSTEDPSDPDGASGGRVNGTAVDPNTPMGLYAASEWGGIYKSTDGGDTWARLDGHRPMATWDVEVDPGNSNRIYATSFFDGRSPSLSGINVSTDGGATWTHPATSVPPAAFCANSADQTELTAFGIGIDPANNANVYVGTSCGLAVSTDSGATWSFTSPVAGGGRIWDLVVSATGSFIDTCGDDGHWFYSSGGGTWNAGSGLPSGRCSIAVSPYSPSDIDMVAVVGTSIYETNNGGATWTNTRANPTPQGRIPFVETNARSTAPAGTKYDLWFGDVSLFSVTCDTALTPNCGTGTSPAWAGPFTRTVGGHDDMGSILFDPTAANDACPVLMSSDGGVYRNLESTSPGCQTPSWEQPTVTPHGLWPFAMSGADRAGTSAEDLYFGNQDNGVFGTTDAGAATPTWENEICCDGFDTAADDAGTGSIMYSVCCFGGGGRSTRFFRKGAGFSGGGEINTYPAGGLPAADFKFPDSIFRWDPNKYAMITRDCTPGLGGCPGSDGGVFITQAVDAAPIVWTELGNATEPPSNSICGIKAGTAAGVPTFYVQTGNCNAESTTDRMFKFTGTNPAGTWSEIFLPQGGFGIFTVNESDPDTLLASGFTATDAFMYKSTDGGGNWTSLGALDTLMRGGGDFPIRNQRGPTNFTGMNGYRQPSLVAIDPTDPALMVAGGRDSGVFVSTDAGSNWSLVTDPRSSNTSGTPHIPRPWQAYFDSEPGTDKAVYIASQGRGIWRLVVPAGGCTSDAFEPDNTAGLASAISSGVPQTHSICPVGDEDWATFTLSQESAVTLETSGPSGDTRMWLRDAGQNQIEFNDDGGTGLFSLIDRECTVDALPAGTYFVQIDEFGDNDEIPTYDLSLTAVACGPVTLTVTNTNDSGAGSLRQAIADAPSDSIVNFDPSLSGQTITLTTGQILIDKNLDIGAFSLADGITVSGNNASRVFEITPAVSVELSLLTITGGSATAQTEGGIPFGGGIYNSGDLFIVYCTVFGNSATGEGGGIYNEGTIFAGSLTFSGNSADIGGALSNGGPGSIVTLANSTFSGNNSSFGGAVSNNGGEVNLNHVTIANNAAGVNGGGFENFGGTLNIENAIVAGNTAAGGPDIWNDTHVIIPAGANLIGNNDTVSTEFPAGPLVGTPGSPLDPLLGPLADNGGRNDTRLPLVGSLAIDNSIATGNTFAFDQRDLPRPFGPAGDIGSVELQAGILPIFDDGFESGDTLEWSQTVP